METTTSTFGSLEPARANGETGETGLDPPDAGCRRALALGNGCHRVDIRGRGKAEPWIGADGPPSASSASIVPAPPPSPPIAPAINLAHGRLGHGAAADLALIVLKTTVGQRVFETLGGAVTKLLSFADVGSGFVFGVLGDRPLWGQVMATTFGEKGKDYVLIFAFQVGAFADRLRGPARAFRTPRSRTSRGRRSSDTPGASWPAAAAACRWSSSRTGPRLRGLRGVAGRLPGPPARPPRGEGDGAHQRRRLHQPRLGARRPDAHHRPPEPLGPQPARRAPKRRRRAPLPRPEPRATTPASRRALEDAAAAAGAPARRRVRRASSARATRRRPRSGCCARSAATPSGMSHRARGHRGRRTWASRSPASPASRTWRPASSISRSRTTRSPRPPTACATVRRYVADD